MQLSNLDTEVLGRNFIYYKVIDSTQKQLWKISKDAPNGTLIMADIQTNGVGTHGRTWYTDEEKNIAISFLLKPNCNICELEGLTMQIAQIIVDIFKNNYNVNLQIKHPNDIVFGNKKIGGILTETKVKR